MFVFFQGTAYMRLVTFWGDNYPALLVLKNK